MVLRVYRDSVNLARLCVFAAQGLDALGSAAGAANTIRLHACGVYVNA